MREIKFRGKRTDNGKWVYGDFLNNTPEHEAYICDEGYCVIGCIDTNTADFVQAFAVCVDPDTIGQYTGLKDKNGRDIYEGDILTGPYPFDENYYAVISTLDEAPYCFIRVTIKRPEANCRGISHGIGELFDEEGAFRAHEIIGNIHDNPELLEPAHE